jgi:molybdate transport system substrate-binding protein
VKLSRRSVAAVALSLGITLGVSACASTQAPAAASTRPAVTGAITVLAAASLTGTFSALATRFEAQHRGATVRLSFAGSADLVTQITNGAPADVFASADTKNMTKLVAANLLRGKPVDFATNVLEIAVPPGNPASIRTFADLAKPGVRTVVCAPQVPCGSATVAIERASGVTLTPVSEESAVTDVLGKVSSGEADAGLVYVTDVRSAGSKVTGIAFAESSKAVNTYPIAALTTGSNLALAKAFIDYVTGPVGQRAFAVAGFGKP